MAVDPGAPFRWTGGAIAAAATWIGKSIKNAAVWLWDLIELISPWRSDWVPWSRRTCCLRRSRRARVGLVRWLHRRRRGGLILELLRGRWR